MFRRFLGNRSGNFAVIFAITIVPIFLTAGVALDLSRLANARSAAQEAADAAALMASQLTDKDVATMKSEAETFFVENFTERGHLTGFKFNATRTGDGTVKVTVDGKLANSFGDLPIYKELEFKVEAAAGSLVENFIDVYLALDRSASMLIADGDTAIAQMKALTLRQPDYKNNGGDPDGCAFACHYLDGWQTPGTKTFLQLATENNIPMRMRRVTNAAKSLATQLLDGKNNIRIGLLDFGYYAKYRTKPTSSLSKISSYLVEYVSDVSPSQTRFPTELSYLDYYVGKQGSGNSSESPKKIVVLITDGLYTWVKDYSKGFEYEPFDSKYCSNLKANGIDIAVINTMYDPMKNSWRYINLAKPNIDAAKAALKACANDGYYFEANDPGVIEKAFSDIEAIITKASPRLLY